MGACFSKVSAFMLQQNDEYFWKAHTGFFKCVVRMLTSLLTEVQSFHSLRTLLYLVLGFQFFVLVGVSQLE